MNNKGDVNFFLLTMILMILILVFTISPLRGQSEQFQRQAFNANIMTCQGTDDEGTVFEQQQSSGDQCPCDKSFVDKYLIVKEDIRVSGGAARNIFDGAYLDEFNTIIPFRISESDFEIMKEYREAKVNFAGGEQPYMIFGPDLENHYNPSFLQNKRANPSLSVLCPNLLEDPNSGCTEKQFVDAWFEGGYPKPNKQCKTITIKCEEDIAESCFR